MPRIDNHHRIWEGHVPGPREARALYGIGDVAFADELPGRIAKAKAGYRRAYVNARALQAHPKELKGLTPAPDVLADALDELRAVKTAGEISFLREANRVSGLAHLAVLRAARPGMKEYQVQAVFEAECLKAGLRHLAYPSIVATGRNAAVLHYRRNADTLRAGQLLLIDAGAECMGYAADITRTFPVGRRFTPEQRDVYSIVLETQKAVIERARAGVVSADLHVFSMTMIAEGLRAIGVLAGSVSGLVEGGAVRLFYPHGIGHLLGLDVHDGSGGAKRRLPNPNKVPVRFVARLEAGFVITVEPGVYFIEALLRDPEMRRRHRGSVRFDRALKLLAVGGVRIEDDVVVREGQPPLNLTDVPKEIAEVEACRR